MKRNVSRIIASVLLCMTLFSVASCYNKINREEILLEGNNYEEELKALTANKLYNHKKETQAIIDKHKNDFTYSNAKSYLKSHGGYVKYVKSLGGVFEKYINDGKPVKITSYTQLAEVADYVWGLYDIWGVDYSNGCGYKANNQYNYNNGGASRFYTNKNPVARFNVNYSCYGFANGSSLPGVDEMLANPDKYYATTNCDMGVCQLLKKAGLIGQNMPGPGTYPATFKSKGYSYTLIKNAKDLMPGDVIVVMKNNNVNVSGIKEMTNWYKDYFHTTIVIERDDNAKTITLAESGHKYTKNGTYRSVRALGDPEVYKGHTKWVGIRYNFAKNLKDDRYILYDKTAPKLGVKYSNTNITNGNVKATITSNEEVQAVSGWTLSKDKKSMTKDYSTNTKNPEKVTVSDLANNKSTIEIKITNIDKTPPTISVEYDNKEPTNKDVLATIKSNETLKAVDGWSLSNDKKSLSKSYKENASETIKVCDLAGNGVSAKVEVKNIDKELPKVDISYSTTELTNKSVTVTIKSSKKINGGIEGWTANTDNTMFTKEYTANTKESFEVSDMVGNTAKVEFEISNIYVTKLESEIYDVKEDIIIVKELGITIKEFKNNNKATAQTIKIVDRNGAELTEDTLLGTGCKIILDDTLEYTIILLGDFDGDGKVNIKEVAKVQKVILENVPMDDIYLRALDFNGNEKIDVSDLANVGKLVRE